MKRCDAENTNQKNWKRAADRFLEYVLCVSDDYAEIWVEGELSRALGQSVGSVIAGWNAENRLVVGRNVKPGQQIQVAIFGVNGPLSNPPTNFIYMRFARLSFFKTEPGPVPLTPSEVNVEVVRNDPKSVRV